MQDIWDVRCDEENHNLSTNYFLELNKRRKKGCTESRNLIIGECRRLRRISYYVRNFFPFMHLVEGVSVLADFKSWFLFVCAYVRDFLGVGRAYDMKRVNVFDGAQNKGNKQISVIKTER